MTSWHPVLAHCAFSVWTSLTPERRGPLTELCYRDVLSFVSLFKVILNPVGNSSISHQIISQTTLIAFLNFKLPHFQSLTNIDPCSHYGKKSNSSLLLPVTVGDRTGGGDMVYSQAYSVTIWLSIYFGFKRQSCWEISQSFPSKNLNKKLVAGNRPRALKKNQYFNV